ncbi:MAG: hypothetical protein H0X73_01530 [Chthoniobacterales bacterium]|nr:hypothetical protein [Chthoniobacterales bacterium]
MKTTLLSCLCSAALAVTLFAQDPAATPPDVSPANPDMQILASPVAPAAPAAAPAPPSVPPSTSAGDLESRINKKAKRGVNITFGDDEKPDLEKGHVRIHDGDIGDGALMAIPIVGIIFTTLFGAPVLVVGLIMFFSYWKARSLHRTVRLMVEKGQPVPEALFATPHSPARARSDVRRGVVLMMIGVGLMVFFGAVNDWDGGAWAIGIIPFLIGAGYLLVWKLEGPKPSTDNAPRVS